MLFFNQENDLELNSHRASIYLRRTLYLECPDLNPDCYLFQCYSEVKILIDCCLRNIHWQILQACSGPTLLTIYVMTYTNCEHFFFHEELSHTCKHSYHILLTYSIGRYCEKCLSR